MREDFRLHFMPMMTSSTTYAVVVKMALVKRGSGRQIRDGGRGIEKWHGADRWQVDFSSSPEADCAIVSLHNIPSQLLSTGGTTIWEVRDFDDRTLRFDGHPNGS